MEPFFERVVTEGLAGASTVHHRSVPAVEPRYAEPKRPLADEIRAALTHHGIDRLWSHQAAGLDRARAGQNVLLATPTSSGKTLLFALSVLETTLTHPDATALFVYPTKALAQDQLAGLRDLAGGLGALRAPRFEIYDGDTAASRRKKIRADPPHALLTNPDMLHHGILAHHADWSGFLARLRWIVLDELHVYRGLFGAHVHHIVSRLRRLCAHYGARPQFVAASATVGNPATFAETLVGEPFAVVEDSGAPRTALDVAFLNPVGISPYTVAVRAVAEAVGAGLRTIAFTKARRITELVYTWLVQQRPDLARRVAPYRAGYLPEERRALEARLFGGDLAAIISTSALELGIDVGALDLCVLVGYPGSLVSSWQRIGRVGRRAGRRGTVLLVAMPDALDQYVVHHPELFFGGRFERAVLDPWNPRVSGRHLVCAAAEEPLVRGEIARLGPIGSERVRELVRDSRLVEDAAGERWFSLRRRPQRDVHPRSIGESYAIVDAARGKPIGRIDGVRVWHECHVGAVYLHGGRSYLVERLDTERRRVVARPARVDYYTVVLGDKETEILETLERREVADCHVGLGRLRVTVRIREFQQRRLSGGEPLATRPLDAPPLVFETIGFWIELPPGLPDAFAARELHFMGGIHATEHAMIGLFPLLAIADRGDVGGISYTGHAQLGAPAIFVYDGVPGGAGLAERGFRDLLELLGRTRELVAACPCTDGCPGCIQSPQCGNGNKPLDKAAARLVLDCLTGRERLDALGVTPVRAARVRPAAADPVPPSPRGTDADGARRQGIRRAGNIEPGAALAPPAPGNGEHVLVFDLETQRSAEEVGGWQHSDRMGLALAVVYDARAAAFRTYHEADVHRLLLDLVLADRVIGFNIERFDLLVLAGYTGQDLGRIRTLDLLAEIRRRLGFRLSLDHLAQVNLGRGKQADGLQSLRWWREGRIDLIESYCRADVDVTRRLWELGRRQGFLLYRDHAERTVRVPVDW